MITVYADFNEPLSYLASQRADRVSEEIGTAVRWCAVEHDRSLPASGRKLDEPAEHTLLQDAVALALPGEHVPSHWPVAPNTRAAVAAYAESLSDGCEAELRRALFDALVRNGKDISAADDVRRVVARVMIPELADLDGIRHGRPWAPLGVPDPMTVVRQLGGTTTRLGGPLTSVGQRRIDQWRAEWSAQGEPALPLVVTPLGERLAGARGLAYLARLLPPSAAPGPVERQIAPRPRKTLAGAG